MEKAFKFERVTVEVSVVMTKPVLCLSGKSIDQWQEYLAILREKTELKYAREYDRARSILKFADMYHAEIDLAEHRDGRLFWSFVFNEPAKARIFMDEFQECVMGSIM